VSSALLWAGRAIGAVCGAGVTGLWLVAIWFPSVGLTLSGISLVVAFAMVLIAVVAVIAAVRGQGVVLLLVFFASFFPVGAYLLTVGHWLRWIGVLDLGYAVAGALLWWRGRVAHAEEA
jgi:hypothetical protein